MIKTKAVLPLIAISIICFACNMDVPIARMNLEVVPSLKSITDIEDYLGKHYFGGSPDETVKLILDDVDLGNMTAAGSGWRDLLDIIDGAKKYVSLDLSGCGIDSSVFDPDSSITTGKKYIVNMVLPDEATSIASADPNFQYFDNLKTIEAHNVTFINRYAFKNCGELTDANFPNLTELSAEVFLDCKKLTNVNMPKLTTMVDWGTFQNCQELRSVNFPKLTQLCNYAFAGCKKLESVNFPQVTNPNNYLPSNVFEACENLKSVTMEKTEYIGSAFFKDCKGLVTVNLPNLKKIFENAFENCIKLSSVSFPELSIVGYESFKGCKGLLSINIPKVSEFDNFVFRDTGNGLLTVTMGEIPPILGISTFSDVTSLKRVTVRVPVAAYSLYATGSGPNWIYGFSGNGWDGANYTTGGTLNPNIIITISQY